MGVSHLGEGQLDVGQLRSDRGGKHVLDKRHGLGVACGLAVLSLAGI